MDDRDIFARNPVGLGKLQGLSQEELGSRAGLHLTMITHDECRKHSPTFRNMIKIAAALGVTIEGLVRTAPEGEVPLS